MVEWIQDVVQPIDPEFAGFFLTYATTTPCLASEGFRPHFDIGVGAFSYYGVHSLSSICRSEWLRGDTLNGIATFLTEAYGQDGEHVFIGPQGSWSASIQHPAKVKKLFAIVHMDDSHWGALELQQGTADNRGETMFTARFGDSQNRANIPQESIVAIASLLHPRGRNTSNKSKKKYAANGPVP
jgi:hypothetical protein